MENQEQHTNEKKKAARKAGSFVFTGCMFIGMALGWYFEAFNIGMFAGMGMGFIMWAVIVLSDANKK